jgi:hypothetical protein
MPRAKRNPIHEAPPHPGDHSGDARYLPGGADHVHPGASPSSDDGPGDAGRRSPSRDDDSHRFSVHDTAAACDDHNLFKHHHHGLYLDHHHIDAKCIVIHDTRFPGGDELLHDDTQGHRCIDDHHDAMNRRPGGAAASITTGAN